MPKKDPNDSMEGAVSNPHRKRRVIEVVLIAAVVSCLLGIAALNEPDAAPRVVINEIEINPPGLDTDNEWVELLNLSEETIDLAGWSLSYSYRVPGLLPIAANPTPLPPGGRYVFVYPGLRLRNGERQAFRLYDAEGLLIDETSPHWDREDDDRTWQRFPDGGDPLLPDLWVFRPATRSAPNEWDSSDAD